MYSLLIPSFFLCLAGIHVFIALKPPVSSSKKYDWKQHAKENSWS